MGFFDRATLLIDEPNKAVRENCAVRWAEGAQRDDPKNSATPEVDDGATLEQPLSEPKVDDETAPERSVSRILNLCHGQRLKTVTTRLPRYNFPLKWPNG